MTKGTPTRAFFVSAMDSTARVDVKLFCCAVWDNADLRIGLFFRFWLGTRKLQR